MRKRLIEKFTKAKEGSFGYTMTELLVVVAIIAIVAAIAIPSVIAISRALKFKRVNDHAKSIFLAAQQNLTEMRSDGGLKPLQSEEAAGMIIQSPSFPEEFSNEYVYTTSQASGDAFELILPVGSVEGSVRSENIIIEYNPITGNVYSVFYYEDDKDIFAMYADPAQDLPRNAEGDKEERKNMMLGYYDGSGLNSSQLELEEVRATVEFVNGEEGIVRVLVPVPDDYFSNVNEYAQALKIDLTITGEYSMLHGVQGAAETGGEAADPSATTGGTAATVPAVTIEIKNFGTGLSENVYVEYGNVIVVEYPIDSLMDKSSFANYAAESRGSTLTNLMDESSFKVLPGENVTIQADVEMDSGSGDLDVVIEPGILSSVNPMFDFLQPSGDGGYILAVSNGRNLQNLNAIAPTIAELVDAVVFTDDIYWNKTVAYYNDVYGNGDNAFSNLADEAPARALPYFVPIHNENLFGTAKFIFPGDGDGGMGGILEDLIDFFDKIGEVIFGGFNNKKVPTLTDEMDAVKKNQNPDFKHASIQGNGHRVFNLNIDSNAYVVPHDVPDVSNATDAQLAKRGKFYAVGEHQVIDYYFTGLFGYVNTPIENLHIVNPIIKGHAFDDSATPITEVRWDWSKRDYVEVIVGYSYQYNNPATGALVGVCGYNTVITNCSTYIDRDSASFIKEYLVHGDFNKDAAQKWYGVSGEGAVGGLVGYAKSHRAVNGALTGNKNHLAFSDSFAAVAVSGNMRTTAAKDFGYSNGVGAFIGNSQLTNFYNCYASGDVKATNCVINRTYLGGFASDIGKLFGMKMDLLYNGRNSWGAGGFVGTSHGTRYSNCFATGDVTATANGKYAKGAGGFVGFMSLDETSAYGNNDQIAQKTVFTNCYAVGLAVTNNTTYENFSGANGRIVFDPGESYTYFIGDYYRLYAPYYNNYKTEPTYGNSTYIYRDTYFLNYGRGTAGNGDSTTCANPESYDVLRNLPAAHTKGSAWSEAELAEVKSIPVTFFGYQYSNYDKAYFQRNKGLEEEYRTLYAEGYSSAEWGPATATTTHPYTVSASGAVYPFSKLIGMDYYGDWPSKPSDIGMAYYEQYIGDKNTDGTYKTYYLFDKERGDIDTRLVLRDGEEVIVAKDGYAIFSASQNTLAVTVGDTTKSLSWSGESFTIEGKTYYSFILPDELMQELPAKGEFYIQVSAKHADSNDTYTMYFNPGVALSHANPANGRKDAEKPDAAPKTIYVRSARQFKAITALEDFWGKGYSYIQQLNIDAVKYSWADADRKVSSIGNAQKPFQASYSAGYTVEGDIAKQYAISNFLFDKDTDGFFGTIGKDGSIENLIVECDAVSVGGTSVSDVAVLAGRNEGTISNVDMVLKNLTTLTAADNAGLLAGYSSGTVRDCEVSAAAVTVNAKNGGGLIGSAEGTANAKAKVSGCKLTLTGDLTVSGTGNAGGLIGNAEHLSLTAGEPLVSLKKVTATGENAGGLIGSAKDTDIKITDAENAVTVTADSITNSNGTAAGVLGSGTNVTANGVDVTVGTITAEKVAAGFLGTGTNVDASFCDVVIKPNSRISGTDMAAGMAGAIGPQSVFNLCTVTLTDVTVSATAGNAAGYAVEIAAEAEIRNSSVTLGGSAKIEASNNAAGYACTVAGYVGNASGSAVSSSVVGEGTITGKNAAGFACDITGQVASSFVTPALAATKDAYKATNNSKLNVKATGTGEGEGKAAGFALTVGEDATVTNCYALNQITGDSMTGFVGINKGSIDRCMANVTIPGGNAFVATNDGTVTRCYGWYGDGKADTMNTTAQVNGSGKIYSAYFVDLDIPDLFGVVENAPASVVLYDADGKESTTIKSPSTLRTQGIDALTSDKTNYAWIDKSAADEFPYSDELKKEQYEYPMLRAHYGDWVVAPSFAYGVAYYETYKDGSIKIRIDDRSNFDETIEEKSLDACVQVARGKDEGGKDTLTVTPKVTFDATGDIASAGYAIFCRTGDQNDVFENLSVGDTAMTTIPTDVLDTPYKGAYSFYELKDDTLLTLVGENGSVAVDLRFANAIADNENAFDTYNVRTPEQLAKIGAVSASFSQTHDIAVEDFEPAKIDAQKTYNGNGLKLSVSGQTKTWMSTVEGTVQNLNLEIPNGVNAPVFGTVSKGANVTLSGLKIGAVGAEGALANVVSGTMTVPAISTPAVNGMLFGDKDGTVSTGTINVTDAITVSGEVATLFGNVANVTVDGAIQTGKVNTQLFGNVSGTVSTGAINVTGTAAQVFGNVNANTDKNNNVTVNGVITLGGTGKVFGTVGAEVAVTGLITTGDLTGNAITAANAKMTLSGITVGDVPAGSYVIAGFGNGANEVKTGDVNVTKNIAGNVFGAVNGTVKIGAVSTQAAANIFGNVTGGSLTVTSINTNGNAVSGNVFGNVSATVIVGTVAEDKTVTGGPITTGDVSGNVFGTVTANVTVGSITVASVAKDNAIVAAVKSGEVKLGTVTIPAQTSTDEAGNQSTTWAEVPTLIGAVGTTENNGRVYDTTLALGEANTAKSKSLIASVASGSTVENVTVTTRGKLNAPVVGDELGGNLIKVDVSCASAEVAGGVLVNSVASSATVKNCAVTITGKVEATGTTVGGLTGSNAGTLTNNTVNIGTVNTDGTVTGGSSNATVGGLTGTNSGSISGADVTAAINYTGNGGVTIGGIVGEMTGGSLTDSKASGSINAPENLTNKANVIGGAVGKDAGTAEKPATYSNVSTTVAIDENWAGAKLVNTSVAKYLAETDADAIAAICPASFGPVGKFVGYVGGGSFNNCSAVGSKTTKAYQFLGEIKPDTAELQQDSLYLSVADYKDSFPLESAPNLCAPGVTKAWTEWVAETILKAEDDYRVFGVALNNCSFDLTTGEIANQAYKPNFDFYKHDDSKYAEVKLYKTGVELEGNITFSNVNKTFSDLYEAYVPSSLPGTNTAQTDWYYNDNGVYKKVTIVTERKQSGFVSKYESDQIVYIKDSAGNELASAYRTNNRIWWSSWSKSEAGLFALNESVDSNVSYVLLSEDGTKMMAVVGGVATSVDVSASFAESDGYLWKRVNGTFTSATNASVTLAATFDLAANSYNSTTQAYEIGGVPYYLHAYTEASHGYTATFVPSGESNMVCGYNVVPAAPAALSEETIPAEEIGGETGNNT